MNLVQIDITATATQAKAALDDVKLKLDELGSRVADARVNAKTEAARIALDRIRLQMIELNRQIADPKINVEGIMKAQLQLRMLSEEFRRINNETISPNVSSGTSMFKMLIGPILLALGGLPAIFAAGGATAGIALGAGILIGTKKAQGPLYSAFHDMLHGLLGQMRQAAMPLVAPLLEAFKSIHEFATNTLVPQLGKVFSAIAPDIGPLTQGLEALVRGVLPGFISLMKASLPAVSALASMLGDTGSGLGGMFKAMAPAVKAASGFFTMLGGVMKALFPSIGIIVNVLSTALAPVFKVVASLARGFASEVKTMQPSLMSLAKLFADLVKQSLPLIPSMTKVMDAGLRLMNAAIVPLIPPLIKLINVALPPLIRLMTMAARSFSDSVGPVSSVISWVSSLIGKLLSVSSVVGTVLGRWRAFTSGLSGAMSVAASTIRGVWDSTIGAIMGAIDSLISKVSSIGGGILHFLGLSTGGIVGGAATGGVRSNMTWVGEHGPELVSLPFGSTVHSNPDSQRMASGSGGDSRVVLEIRGGQSDFDQFMLSWIRKNARVLGGGNVQLAFGKK